MRLSIHHAMASLAGLACLAAIPANAQAPDPARPVPAFIGNVTDGALVPLPGTPALAVAAPEAPVATPREKPETFLFSASRTPGHPVEFAGSVPSPEAARFLGSVAGADASVLGVAQGFPADFATPAAAGLRALSGLAVGELGFDGEYWWLSGDAIGEEGRDAVTGAIASLRTASLWTAEIGLASEAEVCLQKLVAFASRNDILFQSGSARITDGSNAALDELAGYLAVCPNTAIHVEGHTDSDGAEDLNLALSVSRAEAVVSALVERGIPLQRLYAVGYGESLPIAPNDTPANKQANRRIAFSLAEN
ncbi:OmpA family protein [Arsenicitalea aurantiaca]|nr:OmpA family protein [Arsenicitalea aurantiaca]